MSLRGYVIVSGAPGAGKTTLAVPLAAALGLPLLCKDHIKEALHDAIPGRGQPLAWSKTLGGASFELLWALAPSFPAAVLEANFHPSSDYEQRRLQALPAPVVEVYCRCPAALAAARYTARHAAGARHATHVVGALGAADVAEFQRPMGVGRLIEVETTAQIDVDALADEVRAALSSARQSS